MTRSLAEELAVLDPVSRVEFFANSTDSEIAALQSDWNFWARPEQREPAGDWWLTWMIMAGRGFGKTRSGSEWVKERVCGSTPLSGGSCGRFAIVAETAADARDVMVQGPSGILAVHSKAFRPIYKKSQRALEWPNGAIALTFSAEDPEQLRGPEHDGAWSDEVGKWAYPQETWDMLQFGLRIGDNPRQLVTTTPRPIPLIRELLADPTTVVTRGSTYDNASNLAASFIDKMKKRYEGTRLGRQEIRAELLDDVPNALWTRAMLETRTHQNPLGAGMSHVDTVPDMQRVVVGVDPSGTSGDEDSSSNSVGIVTVGLGTDGFCYILEDATCDMGPAGWSRQVVQQYRTWRADIVVGERNFGGAMVEHTVRTADRNVNYRDVNASRGKVVRAEPVAALYEQGRVRHVRAFSELEDQMMVFTRTGFLGKGSPDRIDAMVWAVYALMLEEQVPTAQSGTYRPRQR